MYIDIFGEIKYFLLHKYGFQEFLLAYIQIPSPTKINVLGNITFTRKSAYEFIDVSTVDRCVGFIKIGNIYYIIDLKYNKQNND